MQYWAQDTGRRKIKQRMDNPETHAILGTRQRRKTNKTKNGQPRNTGNIGHKIYKEGKQNKQTNYTEHFNDKQHDSTMQNRGEQR